MCLSRNSVSTLTHRAAHATWWSAIEIAARYGAQVIVLVVLARQFKPADFVLIAMLLVFTTVATILVDGGFSTALIHRQNTTVNDETTVFATSLGTAVVLAGLLWLPAPIIADFSSQPVLTQLTRLLLFVLPLSALPAVPDALLIQRPNFRARANVEVVSSLRSGIIAAVLAWHGFVMTMRNELRLVHQFVHGLPTPRRYKRYLRHYTEGWSETVMYFRCADSHLRES